MIKYTSIIVLAILAIWSASCTDENNIDTIIEDVKNDTIVDTLTIDTSAIDSLLAIDTIKFVEPEAQEIHEKIVEKYGIQWDFCTCINKADSVNQAMMVDGISDADFDKLMERSDFIDGKCKELTTQANQTPDERAKHAKKVKKCLEGK